MSKSKKKLIAAAQAALVKPQSAAAPTLQPVAETKTASTAPLAEAPPAAAAPAPAPEKKVRTTRPAGLGHPNAKKLVNPQHTLELKKAAAAKLGGSMVWAGKNWLVKVPAGEFILQSREMAALSVATFLLKVEKAPVKEVPVADPTPNATETQAVDQMLKDAQKEIVQESLEEEAAEETA